MQNGRRISNNNLIAILAFLVLLIFGLIVGIILTNNNQSAPISQENLIDTSEKMAGWEGNISDSTRALVLTETIRDKLSTDPDYNPDQAVAEYQNIYDQTTGDLKLYVAIEYANYVYDTFSDLNQAVAILNSVETLINSSNEEDYYLTLADLYSQAGDAETAARYEQIWSDKAAAKSSQKGPNQ